MSELGKVAAPAPVALPKGDTDDRDPLPATMFTSKQKQAQNMPEDKDRLRLIKNLAEQYRMTPAQAIGLAKTCSYFGKTVESCVMLLDSVTDEAQFVHDALNLCKFPEDRVAMCAMLDIDYIPLPEKEAPPVKPRRKMTINGGLGGGHAFMS